MEEGRGQHAAGAGDEPWIAVIGQWRKGQLRLPIPYAHSVRLAGGSPKVLSTFAAMPSEEVPEDLEVFTNLDPYDPSPLEGASGLIIPGGGDIDPSLYGAPRHPRTHNVSQRRDRFELTLLNEALENDMPVLAICHGMQLLNVHLGGTLDQHLSDHPGRLDHYRDRPIAEPAHGLEVKEDSLLEEVLGATSLPVNTHHHQGLEEVAEPLEQVGWADDGVLEAVVSRDHSWVVGVQWHPEAMAAVDPIQLRLFEEFVEAAERFGRQQQPELRARSA